MSNKPTYEDLEQRVKELEQDNEKFRQTEDSLQESEKKYRSILDSIEDGYVELDLKGKHVFFNDSYCRITGYSRDDLFGTSYKKFNDLEGRNKMFQFYNHVYRTGESGKLLDWKFIKKDGELIHVESSVSLIKNDMGESVGFRSILRDITEKKKTKQELEDSEEKFRNLVTSINEGIVIMDERLNFSYVNPTVCNIFGYTEDEFKLKRLFDLFSENSGLEVLNRQSNRKQGVSDSYEVEGIRKNGSSIPILISGKSVMEEGVFKGSLGVLTDISELKEKERLLKDSEGQLRNVLDNSPDLIYQFDVEKGRFDYASSIVEEIWGYSQDDVKGLTLKVYWEDIHPEDRKRVTNHSNELISSSVDRKTSSIVYRWRYPERGYQWVKDTHTLIQQKGTSSKWIVGVIHNINDQMLMEQQLRFSEKKYKNLIDYSPVTIQLTDLKGYTVECNRQMENLTGYTKEEMIDSGLSAVHPDDLQIIQDVINKGLNERKVIQPYEIRFKKKNKEIVLVKVTSNLRIEKNENGISEVIGFISFLEDVTKQRKIEDQINRSLKEKEILLQEIHHRVKNNLSVVVSLLGLQSNTIEDNQIKEVLKESQTRVYTMSAVHETLHGSENLSEIDIKTYLSKITASIFQTYSVYPDKVKLNTDIEPVTISINQCSPLGLIINELISNSLKHAFPEERRGEINLDLKKQDGTLELTVTDDGVGIPDKEDWKNPSTLGLKLVRTLVENQLDGSIDMENKNGTKFTIKFNLDEV